jgi:hypothetical protein
MDFPFHPGIKSDFRQDRWALLVPQQPTKNLAAWRKRNGSSLT